MLYSVVSDDAGNSNVTVFIPGGDPPVLVCHSSQPNFEAIVEACLAGESEGIEELFDLGVVVADRFQSLSERVSVSNGHVYLDGDLVDDTLTKQIVRFLDENVEDWKPLVNFFEKVQANPNEHSREQLFRWLDRHDFTITQDGDIVGYKGVAKNSNGVLVSQHSGSAIVNGEQVNGQIPNEVGSVIEMPRSSVQHDPSVGCHVGLHVGTYNYAKSYARGAMLEVHVNPRDVVSVPTDSGDQKVRCCRYKVIQTLDAPYSTAVLDDDYEDESDDYYYGYVEYLDEPSSW